MAEKHLVMKLKRAASDYAERFQCSRAEAYGRLFAVLQLDEVRAPNLPLDERGDIIITCELCHDDQWWQANYGVLWQAAQWWHCGPFGLDCP